MKTIDQLAVELKLTPEQSLQIQQYVNELVVELLESVKEDIVKNTDDTIAGIKS